MTTITNKLADALRDALETIESIASCAEYEAHNITSAFDAKPSREALAAYDAQPKPRITHADLLAALVVIRSHDRQSAAALAKAMDTVENAVLEYQPGDSLEAIA